MSQKLFSEPVCPYCNELQLDYNTSVNLKTSNYGEQVIYFCESTSKCGKPFYITKVEQDPLYKMKPYVSQNGLVKE